MSQREFGRIEVLARVRSQQLRIAIAATASTTKTICPPENIVGVLHVPGSLL